MRAFVPLNPQPAQSVEENFQGRLGVSLFVGVFDAQDKLAAGMPGVKPVEQSGSCAPDMKRAGGTGSKSGSNFHFNAAARGKRRRRSTRRIHRRHHPKCLSTLSYLETRRGGRLIPATARPTALTTTESFSCLKSVENKKTLCTQNVFAD